MLRSLFKKKSKLVTDAERIQGIVAQHAGLQEQQQAFYQLALANESASLRKLAIEKIEVETFLQPLLQQLSDPELRTLVERKLNAEQQNAENFSPEKAKETGAINVTDTKIDTLLACQDLDQAESLIKDLTGEQLAVTVNQHKDLMIRCLALSQIDDLKALQQFVKAFKGKNKALYRAAKDAANAVKSKLQSEEQWRSDFISLQERLRQIPSLGMSAQLPLTFQSLELKWENLAKEASTEQSQTIANLIDAARQHIDAHRGELDDILTEAKAKAEFEAVIADLLVIHQLASKETSDSKSDSAATAVTIPQLKQATGDAVKRWERALRFAETTANQSMHYQKLMGDLESLHLALIALDQASEEVARMLGLDVKAQNAIEQKRMNDLIKQVNWPSEFAKPSQLIQLEEVSEAAKQRLKSAQEKESATLKEVLKLKAIIESQLRRGSLRPADRLFEKLQAKLEELPTHKQDRLEKSITKLRESIQNLKDWKGFVTVPKKDQLLEAMAELINFTGHVEERAERIKALQAQWKELKYDNSEDDAFSRFKSLADQAYAPCARHFEEKSKIRTNNLIAKEKICDDLIAFCTSVSPNALGWEKISEIKKQAKQDWKQIGPVDNVKIKVVNKRFSQALDALDQVFEQALTDSLEEKSRLIDQAQQLLALEDNAEAIEKAKRLQTQWSKLEKLPYSRERDLWKKFRSHLDEIFAARAQLRNKQKASEKLLEDSALAVIKAVEKLAKEEALLERLGELDTLNQQFEALEFENSGQKNRLSKRLTQAVAQVRQRQGELQDKKQAKQIAAFKAAIDTIGIEDKRYYEEGKQAESNDEPSDLLDFELSLPGSYQECFQLRVAAAKAFRCGDNAERKALMKVNQKEKEAICLDLEILNGAETPSQWKDQRLQRQVEMLSSAMMSDRQDTKAKEASIQSLSLKFRAIGFAETDEVLNERFESALKA